MKEALTFRFQRHTKRLSAAPAQSFYVPEFVVLSERLNFKSVTAFNGTWRVEKGSSDYASFVYTQPSPR